MARWSAKRYAIPFDGAGPPEYDPPTMWLLVTDSLIRCLLPSRLFLVGMLFAFCSMSVFPGVAQAQSPSAPRVQPVDVIEATPLAPFSDKTGIWPSENIDSERLLTSGQSIFDSSERVLGVGARGSLSKGSPAFTLRGSVNAGRVLSLYDGIPLNLGDGVGAQELLIPREVLEQLTVLRGPSSIYYGASAMAGGLNFQGAAYNRARVRASVGSFGQKGVFGALPVLSSPNSRLQITAFTESVDGDYRYRSLSTLREDTRRRTDTHLQRWTLSGEQKWEHTDLWYRGLFAQEFGSSPGSETFPDPIRSRKTGHLLGLKLRHQLNDRWSTRLSQSVVGVKNSSFTESSATRRETSASSENSGVEINYKSTADWNASGFLDYSREGYRVSENSTQSLDKQVFHIEPGGIFDFALQPDVRLQVGSRYLPTYGEVLKSLGARQVEGAREYFVGYSEGFRRPSLSDLHEQTSFFRGNPNLKPEKSNQIELGLVQQSDRFNDSVWNRFSFAGSVFNINYEDLLIYQDLGGNVSTRKNEDSANAFGAEIQAGYPFRLVSIEAGYAHLETSARGRPVAFTTEQQYYLAIAHYFGPLVMELRDTQTVNYRYGTGPKETWSWNTLDLTVRTIGLNDYVVQAGLLNILDQPRMYTRDYPEPQRRFFLTLERIF